MTRTVKLLVAKNDEPPAFEEVLVEPCGDSTYRLVKSPGLALGVAAEDIFLLRKNGAFEVVHRGRNVCIQIFLESVSSEFEAHVTSAFARIGGRLDGRADSELVYTVSVDVGFSNIDAVFADITSRYPMAGCYYGNVYDENDGVTPLNWWNT